MAVSFLSRAVRPLPARFLPRLPRVGILDFFALQRQRRHLRQLDAHLLEDVGISRDEAFDEGRRPLWDVPDWWK
ncbi:DUF1127 domain-containing protein [Poseidonocella sp. HB161398]|uniref:DUF1127 domain-containing protein n=1 Tax=Poseidonocella sp. HB161398 TaxID=2320855 RepID=UPI001107F2AE|nr:DUF1127 domain-containing protein [Poseidonocella sp. HB161398]